MKELGSWKFRVCNLLLGLGLIDLAASLLFELRKKETLLVFMILASNKQLTFARLTKILSQQSRDLEAALWYRYIGGREKRINWELHKFVVKLAKNGDRVADICSGAGHLARFISASKKKVEIYNLEYFFWLTYAARKTNLVPKGVWNIVADANYGLPFESGSFQLVTCVDSLMYLNNQKKVVSELERITSGKGACWIGHVHNATAKNVSQGRGLSAKKLKLWLEREAKLVREEDLLNLRLGKTVKISDQSLDSARVYSVFSGKRSLKIPPLSNKEKRGVLRRINDEDGWLLHTDSS